jgi:hypothetical protein
MPRSTTPTEGRDLRNQDRIKRLIRVAIAEELDALTSERLFYHRASSNLPSDYVQGQIKYYDDMLMALRRLQERFKTNRTRHVPQEHRNGDS